MERELDESGKREVREMTGGQSLGQMSAALLRALDPDVIAERAAGKPGADPREVEPAALENAKQQLALEACTPFDKPEVRDVLVRLRQQNEQTIDRITIDQVIDQGFDADAKQKADSLVKSFRDYIEQHRAEIAALQILYSRPFKQRLTEEGLKELEAKLKQEPQFGPDPVPKVWSAFERSDGKSANRASQTRRFTDLISLVRTAIEPTTSLEPFEDHVKQRFIVWLEEKRAAGITFTADQLAWLEKMRDYIRASGSVDRDHLEADNVLGPIYRAFGERLWPLMEELNLSLAA
jgi:type I restriction enzyme R subunit